MHWLEPDELKAWRTFVRFDSILMAKLDSDLVAKFGLSIAEYEVLVHLSEAENHELRMSLLADLCLVSRSGLTRRLERLVDQGLVEKNICPSDRRGMNAKLTDIGLARIIEAAPTHVAGVRNYFISKFSKEDLHTFTRFLAGPLADLQHKTDCGAPCDQPDD